MKLNELISASKVFNRNISETIVIEINTKAKKDKLLTGQLDSDIKNFTQMAKNLNSFRILCESDKLSLLKYGCREIHFLRLVESFDPSRQTWILSVCKLIIIYYP